MIKIELQGLDEAVKMFERLGQAGEKYLQKALTEVAIEGVSTMKVNTPVITGRLRSSMHHESPRTVSYTYKDNKGGGHNGKFAVNLTGLSVAFGTNVEYADAVNYGTLPHVIEAKNKKALFWKGARHPVKRVFHPGTKGQGFFEKAERHAKEILPNRLRINYEKAIKEVLK
jgi:HK97 gp10 family phage protein